MATTEEAANGTDHAIFSVDGGATWRPTQATDPNLGSSPAYYQVPRVVAGDVGFAMNNTQHLRFSELWGIPAAIS